MTKEEVLEQLVTESMRRAIYNEAFKVGMTKGVKTGALLVIGGFIGYKAYRYGKEFAEGWNTAKEEETNEE